MAYENDVLTRNDNDELAVRTVSATEGSGSSSYDDIYTRDTNGKLAVRVVGNGGGGGAVSSVNGKTGAVVLTSADVGSIPQYSEMPEPNKSGDIVQYIGDTTPNYTNGFFYKSDEVSSYSAEQTVGQNVTEIVVDKNAFVNFLENHPGLSVPLTVTMTNVYEPETTGITYGDGTDLTVTCVAAALSAKLVNTFINGYNDLNHADLVFARTQNDTWDVSGSFRRHSTNYPEPIQVSETNVNLSDYGITIDSGTVKQGDTISVGVDGYWVEYDCAGVTGYLDFGIWYKGYFETGDVIVVSESLGLGWNRIDVQTVGLVNTATDEYSLGILGEATALYSVGVGDSVRATGQSSTVVGGNAYADALGGTAVGSESGASGYMASAYGSNAIASGDGSIQLGEGVNSESYSFAVGGKINNTQKEYKLLDINSGLIPAERLANTFYATQGYVLTLDANGNAVWQAGGGGSSYTAGTGIDITNNTISVTSPTLQNNINSRSQLILLSSKTTVGSQSILIGAYSYNVNGDNTVAIGDHCGANGDRAVAIGASAMGEKNATVSIGAFSNTNFGRVTQGTASTAVGAQTKTDGDYSIALGYNAQSTATNAIQIGSDGVTAATNSDANTFKVGNANGNFEMMSADGTVPTARLTKVNTTVTLTAAGWSSNTQTVTVSGVTSSSIVWVSPDPTDQSAYVSAGILCTAQGTDSLTFTATTIPSVDIDVVVVAM